MLRERESSQTSPPPVSSLLLQNTYPPTERHKTTHIYPSTVSVGLKSGHGLLGPLLRAFQGCSQGASQATSFLGLRGLLPAHVVLGGILILMVVGLRSLFLLSAGGHQLLEAPTFLVTWALPGLLTRGSLLLQSQQESLSDFQAYFYETHLIRSGSPRISCLFINSKSADERPSFGVPFSWQ